jgi:glycosyltransferase involved in cell wall biosynthesis
MRVGIVTTWFERGAAYVSRQYRDVWQEKHEVFIYARGGEFIAKNDPNWNSDNISYGRRYKYTVLDLIDLVHFRNWIDENDLDLIFFNEQHLWQPILLCHELGLKIGTYIDYYTQETIPFFELFDFLVCNTKRHYSVFSWHPQIFYIPWGTQTEIFNKEQRKLTDKKELIFFHSAGMNPYRKGTDLVISAFNKLKSEKAKLIIHAQTNILDFFPRLQTTISRLNRSKKLEIITKTVPAPGLYHLGDIYVYPTRLEGIGLTIAEANACGMPVITTNAPPMNEFVSDGINGKLIDVKLQKPRRDGYFWKESEIDVDHLVQLLEFYISNIDSLDRYKDDSYHFAQSNLSWTKNSNELLNILEDVHKLDTGAKRELFNKIKAFERNRGFWFYIANLRVYVYLKKRFLKIINSVFH